MKTDISEEALLTITVCPNGWGKVLVNGVLHDLARGSMFINSPLVQSFVIEQSDNYQAIRFSESVETVFSAIEPVYQNLINSQLYKDPFAVISVSQLNMLLTLYSHILKKQNEICDSCSEDVLLVNTQMSKILRQFFVLGFMLLIMERRQEKLKKVSKMEQTTFDFLKSLLQNCVTERSMAFYASQSGLTENHFTHVIKKTTGRTPKSWISDFTILKAKQFLSEKGVRVKEVSDRMNFPDPYTFGKFFKKNTGMSPTEYQQGIVG